MSHSHNLHQKSALPLCFSSIILALSSLFLGASYTLPYFAGAPAIWGGSILFFVFVLLISILYGLLATKFIQNFSARIFLHGVFILVVDFFSSSELSVPPDIAIDFSAPVINLAIQQLFILQSLLSVNLFFFCSSIIILLLSKELSGLVIPLGFFVLTGIFGYVFIIGNIWSLAETLNIWSDGAILVGILACFCGACGFKGTSDWGIIEEPSKVALQISDRLYPILLGAVTAGLLVGFTNYVTTDMAATPILWAIPFLLYVLSYCIAFNGETFFSRAYSHYLQAAVILLFVALALFSLLSNFLLSFSVNILLFLTTCLVCHHELNSLKSKFFCFGQFLCLICFGMLLGVIFVVLVAPYLFSIKLEYTVLIIASIFLRYCSDAETGLTKSFQKLFSRGFLFSNEFIAFVACVAFGLITAFSELSGHVFVMASAVTCGALFFTFDKRWLFAMCAGLLLFVHPVSRWSDGEKTVYQERSFWGSVSVRNDFLNIEGMRSLLHENALRGAEFIGGVKNKLEPVSYYSQHSGLGDVFNFIDSSLEGGDIAVLGAADGSISCHGGGRFHFDFFESNPSIVSLIRSGKYFSYLDKCGSASSIHLGDVRDGLSGSDKLYTAVVFNAHYSGGIPVHLITKQAIALYMSKLQDNGLLVMNITNKHLNLENEILLVAKELGLHMAIKETGLGQLDNSSHIYFPSKYAVLAKDKEAIIALRTEFDSWSDDVDLLDETHLKAWTDDSAFILRAVNSELFRLPWQID